MGNDSNNGASHANGVAPAALIPFGSDLSTLPLKRTRSGVFTSLNLDNRADQQLFMKSQVGEVDKAEAHLNSVLAVTNLCLAPASAPDPETGNVEHWIRCVLILADGKMVGFGSQGILKSLALYLDFAPPPPWDPPMEFLLKSTAIGKNRWYSLEPATVASTVFKGKRP